MLAFVTAAGSAHEHQINFITYIYEGIVLVAQYPIVPAPTGSGALVHGQSPLFHVEHPGLSRARHDMASLGRGNKGLRAQAAQGGEQFLAALRVKLSGYVVQQ